MSLENYTDNELLEELVRRRNIAADEKPKQWCEDCKNFVCWTEKNDPPDGYNPCSKKHEMKFFMPECPAVEACGFYRTICSDRHSVQPVTDKTG